MVIRDIDRLLPGELRNTDVVETERHARRQDVINELLARANRAAQKAKRVTIALVSVFF